MFLTNEMGLFMKKLILVKLLLFFVGFIAISAAFAENQAGDMWIEPVTGMEFVWVPEGCFMMGSNSGESIEMPVHKVCLDGFWMGKYEVTQGQWKKIMGTNPAEFKKCGDDCPIESVSWYDSQDFIKRLGGKFSLPTEAQWEYAARSGGRDKTYSGSNDVDKVAWYSNNSQGSTHAVGTKAPNDLGIFDMSGNVWEWCQDWRGDYPSVEEKNPTGPSSGFYRVTRGGGWYSFPSWVRSTDRARHEPEYCYLIMGFRLIRPQL